MRSRDESDLRRYTDMRNALRDAAAPESRPARTRRRRRRWRWPFRR